MRKDRGRAGHLLLHAIDRGLPRRRHRPAWADATAELARWLDPLAPAHRRAAGRLRDAAACRTCASPRRPPTSPRPRRRSPGSPGRRAIIFFGIGGSSLGGQTLAQLGGWHIPGMATRRRRRRPRTRFYDNLDAETLESALGSFDSRRHALRRDLQVGRHARDAGAGAGGARRREGGGAREAHARAVPRRHRARRRRQGQRPAHAVRGARHPPARPPPGHRRPLLGAAPTSACCRPWRAGSTRAPCAPAPESVVDALLAAESPARLRARRGRGGRRRRSPASAASGSR